MRTVSWFSCGAASAVATKLALSEGPVTIAYCEVVEEHLDNARFLRDCEEWFGQKVVVLGNDKYHRSIYEVFLKTRYLKGPKGAKCTGELKKRVREVFQLPTDRQVFGYTREEEDRVNRFIDANNDVDVWPILIERGLSKADCLGIVQNAGIELPMMYKLGYRNNNCVGCVKGEAGYWNKIRIDFPEVFERMAQTEEALGRTVTKLNRKGKWIRPTLRELPPDAGNYPKEQEIECGIFCHMAEDIIDTGENS
ncbi:hypothetical protein LCGC14_1860010 [marine sediment metagenome]|uniref:Phosphoadenosine phosphosulphate reductase domain-containing protein n=1 Tax=marine sediment metagenome TaxID=412755 RepID=A0A0F9G7P5_9ZZZZ